MKKTKIVAFILLLTLTLVLSSSCRSVSPEPASSESTPPKSTTPESTPTESTEHICDVKDFEDVPGEHASICTVCNTKHLKAEACRFVREFCMDEFVTCTICGKSQYEPPEEHDMKYVSKDVGCWYTYLTYACSKCGMEEIVHGDHVYPQHAWSESAADGKTVYKCTRCSVSFTVQNEIGEFSYAEVLEEFKIGDPGVQHEGFYFTVFEYWKTDRPIDIGTKAGLELKRYEFEYDTVSVSFDEESNVWCVDFYTESIPGGGCSVYIDDSGCICYMIFGE